MSGSINRVEIMGHLGRDPEVRRLDDGRPVVSFSIATSESWRDKATGERKERTEWHNVVIFNEHLCGIAEQYLKKGSKAFLAGKMQTRKWTDKDGHDRWSTEVVLPRFGGELVLLDRAPDRPAPSPEDYGSTRTRDEPPPRSAPLDDDIPF